MRIVLFFIFLNLVRPAYPGEFSSLLQGVLTHPSVTAAKDNANAAQYQMDAATDQYFGSGTLSSGWHQFEGQRIVGVFVPGITPLISDKIIQSGASYSIPVDLFGIISANKERSKQELGVAEFSAQQQVLFKLHQASTAYLVLQSLEKQKQALALYKKRVELTLRRMTTEVELGRAARVDELYVESEFSRVSADQAVLETQIEKAQADILEASGISGFLPISIRISIPAWEVGDASSTLPVKIASSQSAAAKARSEEARTAMMPAISLDTSYFNYATPSNLSRNFWQVGGVVSIPLGKTQFSQYEAQKLKARAAEETSQSVLRESERQLSELRSAYQAAVSDASAMEQEIAYRQKVVEVQRQMQKLGNQTLENLFTHERDLLDAQVRFFQAQARAAIVWSAAQVLFGAPVETYIAEMESK